MAGNGSSDGARPERSLVRAFAMMTSVSARLQLSICVREAWNFYKKAQLILSKRSYDNLRPTVSVCLYLAGLCQGKPRSLEDILTAEFRNPRGRLLKEEARDLVKFLVTSLHLELMGAGYKKSSSRMRRYSVLLGMGRQGYPAAMVALKKIEKDFAWIGSDVLEAAAIFMAAKRLPLLDVSIITGVEEEKINSAHQEICTFLAKQAEKKTVAAAAAVQQAESSQDLAIV